MEIIRTADAEPLLHSLLSLAWVVEARDPYTGGHLWRVSQFSMLLAKAIGLGKREIARIGLGGFLHDLGKIGIPDAILNKPDRLTEEEYAVIKTHPRIGAELLGAHPLRPVIENAVYLHHETPDGKGYPNGYVADKIPMDARIVGLTDAFDAMTSTRPYRKGMPTAKALEIITANLGGQFDRELGEAFIAVARAGLADAIIGHTEPHIPLQACVECGPTILITRRQLDGDIAYCRACGGGVRVRRQGGSLTVEDMDLHGDAETLAPRPDSDLIRDLVADQFLPGLPLAA